MPTFDHDDSKWMRLALAEAAKGQGSVEPNPMVGAVIVDQGRLVGIGHHARFGGPHAEVAALNSTSETTSGLTMHVTLEPCRHHGKTPPCTGAILKAGISRAVVASRDPFPQVDGGGIAELRAAGVRVDLWPIDSQIATDAIRLNRPFFKRVLTEKPYVIAKWAMSLDGRIALASGDSRWISNERSRAIVHGIRGRVDAIIVGIGTAVADDPSLTVRPPGLRTPARIVVDPRAELPLKSVLVKTVQQIPVKIYCSTEAPSERRLALEHAGCEITAISPSVDGSLSPEAILLNLGSQGMTNVLVEGGSRLLGRFFDSGCIDEVAVFVAPVLFGGPAGFPPLEGKTPLTMEQVFRLFDTRTVSIGSDTLIQGSLRHEWMSILENRLAN
jgi:diaminohydroxyphosphoribosylaminopyrimidine deaminase/5-amino-6-(5-phosphoribosylamino)uracil reductase